MSPLAAATLAGMTLLTVACFVIAIVIVLHCELKINGDRTWKAKRRTSAKATTAG